jgi:hypothetical protein
MEEPVSGRVLVSSIVCLGLAGCVTDKISMSSEVGGSGGSSVVSARANDSGGSGFGGSDGDSGLGVTGDGGVLDNVVGTDPVGGYVEDALGAGNPVSAILGSGSDGLVPSAAAALAGDPNAEVTGLGVLGDGGLVSDLAGTDLVGGSFDTSGVLGASIAGGNDGLLGSLLNGRLSSPPLAPVAGPIASALPADALDSALSQVPDLGVTGDGGLVADLIGVDLVGNLIGENTLLGGGNAGQLGALVPTEDAPLGYVGETSAGLLNIVSGSQGAPVDGGSALAPAIPVLENILGSGASVIGGVAAPVTGALGSTPLIGDIVSGPSSSAAASAASSGSTAPASPAGDALAPVTGALGSVPIVGGILGGS